MNAPAIDRWRVAARRMYGAEFGQDYGENAAITIDRFAKVSTPLPDGSHAGRWVEAWVFVPNAEVPE